MSKNHDEKNATDEENHFINEAVEHRLQEVFGDSLPRILAQSLPSKVFSSDWLITRNKPDGSNADEAIFDAGDLFKLKGRCGSDRNGDYVKLKTKINLVRKGNSTKNEIPRIKLNQLKNYSRKWYVDNGLITLHASMEYKGNHTGANNHSHRFIMFFSNDQFNYQTSTPFGSTSHHDDGGGNPT